MRPTNFESVTPEIIVIDNSIGSCLELTRQCPFPTQASVITNTDEGNKAELYPPDKVHSAKDISALGITQAQRQAFGSEKPERTEETSLASFCHCRENYLIQERTLLAVLKREATTTRSENPHGFRQEMSDFLSQRTPLPSNLPSRGRSP